MTTNADLVECADCHRVYECTPMDDHYEPACGGPRVCYRCLLRGAALYATNCDCPRGPSSHPHSVHATNCASKKANQ